MLLSLSIPVFAVDGPETNTIPVQVSVIRQGGGTIADEVNEMLPNITEVTLGETLTAKHPTTRSLIALTDNAYYEWTYQYVKIDLRYVEGGHTPFDFTPDEVPSAVITPEDGKTIEKVLIRYYWNADATDGRPALVTNVIHSLDRTVQQNSASLEAKTQYGMDIYKVENKNGLTLTYNASMDMTQLGSTMFGDSSWDVLQENKGKISNETYVDLHFQFDSNVSVGDLDLRNADLRSDMFAEKYNESSENKWWSTNEETNELILHCRWDSTSAMGNETLNPMIYLDNVKITLPSNWNGNTLVVRNHGYVDGKVYLQENGNPKANYCDIDGGEKDDEFILTTSDKVSLPGLEKVILDNNEEKDNISASADETIQFQLTSNVPENLLDYIEYNSSDEVDPPEIATYSLGDAKTYTLTFHDKMDEELVNPENFAVTLVDKDGHKTTLNADDYTVNQSAGDGCTFEITLDLGALYTADIIDESDLGTTSIIVTYNATLSEDVTAGTFVNEAWVTNNHEWETSHDKVTVDTYQIDILKYGNGNMNTNPLEGAHFQLYQKNEQGAIIDDSIDKDLVSGEDGHVTVDGLKAGTYYLKETKAPEGYVCSNEEIKIVIPEAANEQNIVHVLFDNTSIPHTGGMGTTMFTIGGAVIVAAAAILFVVSRKKRQSK